MKPLQLALLLTLLSVPATAEVTTTIRHSVLFQGKIKGRQITQQAANGLWTVDYSYRDNGRGPDYKEEIRLDAAGTQVEHRVRGKSTFGAPATEDFERKSGVAHWKTISDSGTKSVSTTAFYVPVNTAMEAYAMLARAALQRPGGKIAALPSGDVTVARIATHEAQAAGRKQKLALYALTGLDLEPTYLWLTDDSARKLFAYVYPGWMQLVLEGWESAAPGIEAAQLAAERKWLEDLATRLTHRLPEPILIRNTRVFDSVKGSLGPSSDVFVFDGRIAGIWPAGSVKQDAATIFDAGGKTLLPGLFDMHDHATAWGALLHVAGGVTTTRDKGNDNPTLFALRARIDSLRNVGPRIEVSGYIEGESEFASRSGFVVKDVEEARRAVDWYATHGCREIKLYNSIKPEWVAPIAEHAHRLGLRVTGHIPAFMLAAQAVRAGYDEITHINQLLLNFLSEPKTDSRTLARFYLIAEKAGALDLDSKPVQDFIALLKQKGTAVDPTLVAFQGTGQRQGELSPNYAAVATHLPIAVQRGLRQNSMDITEENHLRWAAADRKMVETVGRLYRAGIPMVAGTDAIPGFALHRELELYVEAGIPAGEALKIATWNGAKYTGTLADRGTVEKGKMADLVLVDGDPTQNISAIRRPVLTLKGGVAFYPSEIYEALGVQPFVEPVKPKALAAATKNAP